MYFSQQLRHFTFPKTLTPKISSDFEPSDIGKIVAVSTLSSDSRYGTTILYEEPISGDPDNPINYPIILGKLLAWTDDQAFIDANNVFTAKSYTTVDLNDFPYWLAYPKDGGDGVVLYKIHDHTRPNLPYFGFALQSASIGDTIMISLIPTFSIESVINFGTTIYSTLRWETSTLSWVETLNLKVNDSTNTVEYNNSKENGGKIISYTLSNSAIISASTDVQLYIIDAFSNAVDINLPPLSSITDGTILLVKDNGGCDITKKITIYADGLDTIEGDSFIEMNTPYEQIKFISTSTEWLLVL